MNRHLPSTIVGGRHRYTVRVYFEDTDAGGIVYHANFLRFAERARTEAMRDLGIPHAELVARHNLMFIVHRIKMDYLRPARLDDLLTVGTEIVLVGGASVTLRQEFTAAEREGKSGQLALLQLRLACVAPGGDRPERIPERWREALEIMHAAGRTDDEGSAQIAPSGPLGS
jgi:acyl-CoA thioester hydrolase